MIQPNTKLSSVFLRFTAIGTITIMGLMSAGCEDSSRVEGITWNENNPEPTEETPGEPGAPDSAGDMVSFGALNWTYGGFKGGGAGHSGVTISGLQMSGMNLTFKYNTDISAWGASHGDHTKALACLFVKNNAGQWVGGKFDWISSSRTHRGLDHCTFYEGWNLRDVPNPTEAAFVIVHPDGKRRSNVISAPWSR